LWNRVLGGTRGSRSWHSLTGSGCRASKRDATWVVSDSGHPGRGGLTTLTRSFERDTVHPMRGDDSIAAGRSSTNCLATQGWTDQQWSSGTAAGGFVRKAELPLGSRHGKAGGGMKGASPDPGKGVFQRVLVTTSRLQRLVRGIVLGGLGDVTAPPSATEIAGSG